MLNWIQISNSQNYGLAENISDSFESEATATDARYPVDRTVQFKMDFFEGWFQQQTPKHKEIIRLLALGNIQVGVSPTCICQYQKRFRASWNEYIADKKGTDKKEAAKEAA